MIRYACDRCGAALAANDPRRYVLKLEIYAAAAPLEVAPADLARDHTPAIRSLVEQLAQADPDEVENRTYRLLRFDLCDSCRREWLKHPLR
jgi:hypothetical protein